MCNLYTNRKSAAEVAATFRATIPMDFNAGDGEVYPGGQGLSASAPVRAYKHRRSAALAEWQTIMA